MFQYIIKQYQTSLKQAIRKVTTIITTSYKANHGWNKAIKASNPKLDPKDRIPTPDNNDDININNNNHCS
jgi:hypothetical protein